MGNSNRKAKFDRAAIPCRDDETLSLKRLGELLFDELGINKGSRFAVAFSGGVDSTVLLHVMMRLKEQHDLDLVALHFDHAIHDHSTQWRKQCAQWCNDNDIPFFFHREEIRPSIGESLEAIARIARYRWFETAAGTDKVVLTGHHLDDQAETILMNLFQGKSAESLLGMQKKRPLSFGSSQCLVRPLLDVSKKHVLAYAKENKLDWITDTSNLTDAFDRNYLRNQVIPRITERWPSALAGINRTSKKLSPLSRAYQTHIREWYEAAVEKTHRRLFCLTSPLALDVLSALSKEDFAAVVRYWVHKARMASPSDSSLSNLYEQLMTSGFEAGELCYRDSLITCFSRCLYLMNARHVRSSDEQTVSQHEGNYDWETMSFPGIGVEMSVEERPNEGIDPEKIEQKPIQLVWRRGGERITLPKRNHRQQLKKIYQQRAIPPWERARLPMIAADGELVWVAGVGVVNGYQCEGGKTGICPQFKRLCD